MLWMAALWLCPHLAAARAGVDGIDRQYAVILGPPPATQRLGRRQPYLLHLALRLRRHDGHDLHLAHLGVGSNIRTLYYSWVTSQIVSVLQPTNP